MTTAAGLRGAARKGIGDLGLGKRERVMELLLDYTNIRGLYRIISNIPDETGTIYASIAFNTSEILIQKAIDKKIDLHWWGLFDGKQSTRHELIELALKFKNIIHFHPIKQNFHSKLIFFENYGLYIGSANMTNKALKENIETGIFLSQMDLLENNLIGQIEEYFISLEKFPVITDDDVKRYLDFINEYPELKRINNKDEQELENQFNKIFSHLPFNDSAVIDEKDKLSTKNKIINTFTKEWRSTLNILLYIMDYFKDTKYYPKWLDNYYPKGIVADQVIHAYYYSIINDEDERSYPICKKYYEQNKNNKEKALNNMLIWWKGLTLPPTKEDVHIKEWSLLNEKLLSKEKILRLNEEELIQCYLHNHSARNHARQIPKEKLKLPRNERATEEECTRALGKYHFEMKNKLGMNIFELYNYVIYNENEPIEIRINKALNDDYYIPHVGQSLLGELIGWARPNEYPIRNNRVNKVLLALGYNVTLFNKG